MFDLLQQKLLQFQIFVIDSALCLGTDGIAVHLLEHYGSGA